jgi:DNA-binding response OmpR family regulator
MATWRGGPSGETIRALRAENRALRAEATQSSAEARVFRIETEKLRAENKHLAERDLAVENAELRERLRQFMQTLSEPAPLLWNLPLTLVKSRLLGALYHNLGVVTRDRLELAIKLGRETNSKSLDVHICQLRRIMRPHCVNIRSVNRVGYEIPPESRPRLAALIEKQRRATAAATKSIKGSHQGEQHARLA